MMGEIRKKANKGEYYMTIGCSIFMFYLALFSLIIGGSYRFYDIWKRGYLFHYSSDL
jgi:hypothetical protein